MTLALRLHDLAVSFSEHQLLNSDAVRHGMVQGVARGM